MRSVAALAGFAFGVLFLGSAFLLPEGPPKHSQDADGIRAYLDEHGLLLGWGIGVTSLAAIAVVVFAAAIPPAGGPWNAIATTAAGVLAASTLVAGGLLGLPLLLDADSPPESVRAAWLMSRGGNEAVGDAASAARALFVASAALVLVRTRATPAWVAAFGYAVAATALAGAFWALPFGAVGLLFFAGLVLSAAWVLVASGFLLARGDASP